MSVITPFNNEHFILSSILKHQRDKQIIFVYRVDIQLFNLSVGY